MKKKDRIFSCLTILLVGLCLAPGPVSASSDAMDRCLRQAMSAADDMTTIGELRERCRTEIEAAQPPAKPETATDPESAEQSPSGPGAVDRRLSMDQKNILEPFTLMTHRPNYFIFASHTSGGINPEPFQEQFEETKIDADDLEARFQISIKAPLAVNLFEKPVDIYVAYTNRSFWQFYNDDASAPFRETNHEPEIWVQHRPDRRILGLRNNINMLGIVHQSNGRGSTLSRSWNRIYANLVFEKSGLLAPGDTFGFSVKPWLRLPEDDADDDNPDITDFLGHGQLGAAYKWRGHVFSLMLRNHIESGFNKGATEASWSFPLWKYPYLKGFLKWFNGYGESLIDYNQHTNSIGIGILLTDWL